jgi:hypothetical protein
MRKEYDFSQEPGVNTPESEFVLSAILTAAMILRPQPGFKRLLSEI